MEKIKELEERKEKICLGGGPDRLRRRPPARGGQYRLRLRQDLNQERLGLGIHPPQISAILGPCAGGACYSPALTDFILTVDKISQMYLTGPVAVEQATGEKEDQETPGGAMTHSTTSGVAHFIDRTEADCFSRIRRLLSYLLQSYTAAEPTEDPDRVDEALNTIIPENDRFPYESAWGSRRPGSRPSTPPSSSPR